MEKIKQIIVRSLALFLALFLFSSVASAATLSVVPSTGTYSVGNTFSVTLKVNTEGTAINASEGAISFNPNDLEVKSISKSGSVISLWVQDPDYSNSTGTINYGGIIFNPGYTGSSGTILTVTFLAKSDGNTSLAFSSGDVLANDGVGTNVLSSLNGSSYTLQSSNNVPQPSSSAPTPTPKASASLTPEVVSSTHPDSAKWYSNASPQFSWDLLSGVTGVSYLITDKESSNPGPNSDGVVSKYSAANLPDGTHYFHLKFKQNGTWGPITHFQFNVDTTAPAKFDISVADAAATSRSRQITFQTTDVTSDIDHYEVKANDNSDWQTVSKDQAGQPYTVSLAVGDNNTQVKAVDGAGNSTITSTIIHADPTPGVSLSLGKWFSEPFDWLSNFLTKYGLLLLALAALVGLLLLVFRLLRMFWAGAAGRVSNARAMRAGERQSGAVVNKILKDMQDELKFLNAMAKRRHLGPEEKYLKSKIEQYIKTLKNFQR